jgi:hypothetical protein
LSPLVNRREDGYGVLLKIAVVSSVRLLQRYGENGRMKSPWEFAYPPRSMPRAGIHLMMSRHC